MFWRKIEADLQYWLDHNTKTGLYLSGTRRVGKTAVIRSFLEKTGRPYLEVNLAEHADLLPVLMQCVKVRDLELALSAAFQCQFYPGKTILFFDEIHLYPDILTRIKFWAQDGQYRYILSGSSLALNWSAIRSIPVGYLHEIQLYPMDLEEFIRAQGMPENVFEYLRKCFREEKADEILQSVFMGHLRRYLIVGGMPEAVEEYLRSGNLMLVSRIHRDILDRYIEDFASYEAERGKPLLTDIHNRIAARLQRQFKCFSLRNLEKGMDLEQVEWAIYEMAEAEALIPAYGVTRPEFPLLVQPRSSLVKLYLPDVGLLTTLYGKEAQLQLLGGTPKMDLSGLYENFVAQELHAHEFPLFFCNTRQIGLLDLVIDKNLSAVPVIVKGAGDETMHPALSKAVGNPAYGVENAYVLADCNLHKEGVIQYLPLYDTMYLHKNGPLPVLDLESLTWPDL